MSSGRTGAVCGGSALKERATGRISDYFQASVQVRRRALLSARMPAHGGISRLRLDLVWCARGDLRTSFDWLTDSARRAFRNFTFNAFNFIPCSTDVQRQKERAELKPTAGGSLRLRGTTPPFSPTL